MLSSKVFPFAFSLVFSIASAAVLSTAAYEDFAHFTADPIHKSAAVPTSGLYYTAYNTSDPKKAQFLVAPDDPRSSSTQDGSPLPAAVSFIAQNPDLALNYNIDCGKNPQVCENICFYAYCKHPPTNPWQQTKRPGRLGEAPACAMSYNKCSNSPKAKNRFPHPGYQCDEYPMASTVEGGAHAATRCVLRGQNGSAGSKWSAFKAGQTVTTVLDNPSNGGHHCSPYGRPGPYDPTKVCNLDNNDQYYRQA